MTTVPVKLGSYVGGLADCEGLLRLKDSSMMMEIQSKDSIVGVLKSGIKRIEVPFSVIESIEFKKSLFSAKITLRVSSMDILSEIPNAESGEVLMKVQKKHSSDATELVSHVQLGVANQKLKQIEERLS